MRFLFNATINEKGGAAQRAASFIREIRNLGGDHAWWLAVSPTQSDAADDVKSNVEQVHIFPHRPSRSFAARKKLRRLAERIRPDCIFTLSGPAYVSFDAPHLMGVADGWVTHATRQAYSTLGFPSEWMTTVIASVYKRYWYRKADAWVVQTEQARQSLHTRLHIRQDRISVVANTCASHYHQQSQNQSFPPDDRSLRILCFAAPYPHKRLEMVPSVAHELVKRAPDLDFQFVLTLPAECRIQRKIRSVAKKLQVARHVQNVGPVSMADGPGIYKNSDICFLPTLLETFSATYPEAMAMGIPIVTSDLGFARSICGQAALFFEANNPEAAAEAILRLARDREIWKRLVQSGKDMLYELPSNEQQFQKYIALMEYAAADDRSIPGTT